MKRSEIVALLGMLALAVFALSQSACMTPGEQAPQERMMPGVAYEAVVGGFAGGIMRLTDSTRGVTCYRYSDSRSGTACVSTPEVKP